MDGKPNRLDSQSRDEVPLGNLLLLTNLEVSKRVKMASLMLDLETKQRKFQNIDTH
jgi:hypothetical protein